MIDEAEKAKRSLVLENAKLRDKVDGLTSDLENAVETAYKRGATEWCRLNYPDQYKRLTR